MATKPHAIIVPYPAQGHVMPLVEMAHHLATHGIKVTFVNSEFNHRRMMKSVSQTRPPHGDGDASSVEGMVEMVYVPDGMEPWEDRNDLARLTVEFLRILPGELDALIQSINSKEGQRVICLVADFNLGSDTLDVAQRSGLKTAAFWPAAAATLALGLNIPKLIRDGVIDQQGKIMNNQMFRLSPDMPLMNSTNVVWSAIDDEDLKKVVFSLLRGMGNSIKSVKWIVCNSSLDLEPGAFSQFPELLPVGPILSNNGLGRTRGHFWPEDLDCLQWLDQQPPNSVIYVAFGSLTVFDPVQFVELALGLELTGRPFLWVVRQDLTVNIDDSYPEGFKERTCKRGTIVGWAPQQLVLSHPSVACFMSHCGWNSTVESIANGVPFLCWPYFTDQFLNQTYVCDEWKVGLRLDKDENGMVGRGEIKDKVERLVQDKRYKERATELQKKVMDGVLKGSSSENFNSFVEWIKE